MPCRDHKTAAKWLPFCGPNGTSQSLGSEAPATALLADSQTTEWPDLHRGPWYFSPRSAGDPVLHREGAKNSFSGAGRPDLHRERAK